MHMIGRIRSVVFVVIMMSLSAVSFAQIGITVNFGPPALPVYEQPVCPGDGYIWTPGYWAWDPDAGQYYWVPGTWVLAPQPGYLWTPPWWGWGPGGFLFHAGFWGLHMGFYGGINYGYGYFGNGYEGGRWQGGHFFYNRSVTNVNVTNIHNVYNTTVINNNTTVNRVSYNGGNGGTTARPTPQEETAEREQHLPPVAAQNEHIQAARSNPQMRASVNQGKPPIAATQKPGDFKGPGVVQAREAGAPYKPPANEGRAGNNVPRPPTHAAELPAHEVPKPPNTGNAKLDQKYAQQQQKLTNKMNQEHQKLAQQQAREDQRMQQQHASDAQRQATEQRHAQQTQQMQARHQQQIQQMQEKQRPPEPRK
jgi:hypothetical protein